MMTKEQIPNVTPFMGKLLIKIEHVNVREKITSKLKEDCKKSGRDVSDEFLEKLELPFGENRIGADGKVNFQIYDSTRTAPVSRGKIVKKAPDAFGEAFKKMYGADRSEYPDIGDIVFFIPHQSLCVDDENNYHLLDDSHVMGFIKVNNEVKENE